jgi:4'-phosphopantetheinyl transferase EntD
MLERELDRAAAGLPGALRFAAARGAARLARLSPRERRRWRALSGTPRAASWLRGRAALKRLLRRLGEPEDTGGIRFPSPRFALTHQGRWAIAVAARAKGTRGVGIDFETRRPPAEGARFFLAPRERAWWGARRRATAELTRLWTVKEALFKADPGNAQFGLPDYVLDDPAAAKGTARRRNGRGLRLQYQSRPWQNGWLSVAVNEEASHGDHTH